MDEVEAYLQAQDKVIQQDREETLIRLGITQREFSPNGEKTWQYTIPSYENGETRYYREIALPVNEQQWKAILEKESAVAQIEERKKEAERKNQTQQLAGMVQTIVPMLETPPFSTGASGAQKEANDGRSRIAPFLRGISLLIGILSVLISLLAAINVKESTAFWITVGGATLMVLSFMATAEILDRLANIQANMEKGYMITKHPL